MASVPERSVRAAAAVLGGTLHEGAQVVLPRFVRRSRLYEVTAKNLLRVVVEWVGGVEHASTKETGAGAGEIAARKVAGNVIELGSILAFGFSPLWLLAAASDVTRGSRAYLKALVEELERARVIAPDFDAHSVDELLAVLERTSGRTASLIDIPPLELEELKRSMGELRADAKALPSPAELASAFRGLRRQAEVERASMLEVSSGIGLAFLLSARNLGREHLVVPFREDWRPLRNEGFAAYARRVALPYRRAVTGHFEQERPSFTERLLGRARRSR